MGQDIERKLELEEPKVWVRMRRKIVSGNGKVIYWRQFMEDNEDLRKVQEERVGRLQRRVSFRRTGGRRG